MTATTLQPKTTLRPDRPAVEVGRIPEPAPPVAGQPAVAAIPALVVEGVTKRFIVGRKKRPVTVKKQATAGVEHAACREGHAKLPHSRRGPRGVASERAHERARDGASRAGNGT